MSRKQAIDSKCKECIYDPKGEGTWRRQVELCTCKGCPLYPYRPLSEYAVIDSSLDLPTKQGRNEP